MQTVFGNHLSSWKITFFEFTDGFGILLLAEPARTTQQSSSDTQPFAYLLAPLDDPRLVRAQLSAQIRAFQTELAGNLRDVELNVIHASARLDSVLVFDAGGGQLSLELSQLDLSDFLFTAHNGVAGQYEFTVVLGQVTLKT